MLLPENRRRLPLEEQLHYLQAHLDEVSSGKHSIGQSRRAKALRKEISVIKRKLAHQREGVSGMGRESVGVASSLPHHASSVGLHDEGGESSSQEIGGKGESKIIVNMRQQRCCIKLLAFGFISNIYPCLFLRAECFLICISSRGGTSDISSLLQEEPENGRASQKAWAATQEPRC